jgi:hypothetical protein
MTKKAAALNLLALGLTMRRTRGGDEDVEAWLVSLLWTAAALDPEIVRFVSRVSPVPTRPAEREAAPSPLRGDRLPHAWGAWSLRPHPGERSQLRRLADHPSTLFRVEVPVDCSDVTQLLIAHEDARTGKRAVADNPDFRTAGHHCLLARATLEVFSVDVTALTPLTNVDVEIRKLARPWWKKALRRA